MTLRLESVSKTVAGQAIITDASLTLEPGALTVLLGPTLAGKTSLMRLMAGLDRPSSGRILAKGRDVTGRPARDRDVAMVYQQFVNYPSLTVFENIASPLRVARRPQAEIEERVRSAARLLRLDPYLDRLPLQLSGGQQQRVAIARALAKRAGLVLLDEPLANLDYKLREELREELPRLFADSNSILVYATTEPSEALLLGGRTATLHEGRVTQFGRTLDVYRHPTDRRTAEIFSDPPMNFAAARLSDGAAHLAGGVTLPAIGTLARLPAGEVTLGFRPNHLYLRRPTPDAAQLSATVSSIEITGSESFIHVAHDAGDWVALTHGVHRLDLGSRVDVFIDPARLFAFGADGRLLAAAA